MTPQQIASTAGGIQCSNGAGGAEGFPSCVKGSGLAICKNQLHTNLIGGVYETLSNAGSQIANEFSKLPSLSTLLIVGFLMLAILVFIYGYGRSR